MVEVSFGVKVKEFKRGMSRFEKRQMPFAVSGGLNMTGKVVIKSLERLIPTRFDKPVPFTRRPFMLIKSTPAKGRSNTLRATIRVKRIQAEYLETEEFGGIRFPKKTAITIPVNIRTNRYGNLRRKPGAAKSIIGQTLDKDPDTFSGVPRGRPKSAGGLYKRKYTRGGKSKSLKLLVSYQPRAAYKPKWNYRDDAILAARYQFPPNLRKSFRKELARGMAKR